MIQTYQIWVNNGREVEVWDTYNEAGVPMVRFYTGGHSRVIMTEAHFLQNWTYLR